METRRTVSNEKTAWDDEQQSKNAISLNSLRENSQTRSSAHFRILQQTAKTFKTRREIKRVCVRNVVEINWSDFGRHHLETTVLVCSQDYVRRKPNQLREMRSVLIFELLQSSRLHSSRIHQSRTCVPTLVWYVEIVSCFWGELRGRERSTFCVRQICRCRFFCS